MKFEMFEVMVLDLGDPMLGFSGECKLHGPSRSCVTYTAQEC